MEDISRELEKEIAQSRPKPHKKSITKRILIVDDFGKITSGEHFKVLVRVLCVVSVVCFVAAVLFYLLYSNVSKNAQHMESDLATAQKKVHDLTDEKEVLMAKVVMLGQEPSGIPVPAAGDKVKSVVPQTPPDLSATAMGEKEDPLLKGTKRVEIKKSAVTKQQDHIAPKPTPPKEKISSDQNQKTVRAENNMVAIEKFTVTKDGENGDLLVRFDIRNISKEPGDVSGRIFTVLKPETGGDDQWLVVPSSTLNNGIPGEYRKGQYFSIAHFKPVKFRIKNTAGPDFFKTAAIYIFKNKGELIFERLIEITEGKKTE